MASKIKETILKEIRDQAKRYEKGKTKRALLEGLYTKIKSYEDDRDIVNTVWANRELPLRMFTEPELKHMPGLSNLLVGQPYDSKIDYEKAFGKDWYTRTDQIPYNQVAIIAAKQGRDPAAVSKEMADSATTRLRYDAAHEGVLGNLVMPFFAKRTQEAIERGEDPGLKDYGLDLGQTILEAVPYGRAARFASKPVNFLVGRILSNATTPLLTEAADAAAYDTTNTRGKFDWKDVGTGALTNAMGEGFLRTGGAVASKVGLDDIGAKLMRMGDAKSAQQARKEVYGNVKADLEAIKNKETIGTKMGDADAQVTNPEYMDFLRARAIDYYDNIDTYTAREIILKKLKSMYNDAGKKIKSKADLSDEDIRFMMKDPVLSKYVGIESGYSTLPLESVLATEEAVKNLITNKIGNSQYDQGRAFTRIPLGLGRAIQDKLDEEAADEQQRKNEEDIYRKYRFDMFGGN